MCLLWKSSANWKYGYYLLFFVTFNFSFKFAMHTWHRWKTLFNYISTKYAPIRQKRVKNNHDPWITPTIINLMQNRDHAHKMWIKTKSLNWFSQYKRLRNTLTKHIKKSKINYFKQGYLIGMLTHVKHGNI